MSCHICRVQSSGKLAALLELKFSELPETCQVTSILLHCAFKLFVTASWISMGQFFVLFPGGKSVPFTHNTVGKV